jgi:hypothetical protein
MQTEEGNDEIDDNEFEIEEEPNDEGAAGEGDVAESLDQMGSSK